MGRAPCCDKANVKKGPWSPEEDSKLKEYIQKHGTGGNWIALPQKAGLRRCGKSCRLRWLNYLRPNIKHGEFSDEEDRIICSLYSNIGSRWSIIAAQLPGRTDNDIKNYWNTKLKKKLMGFLPASPHHRSTLPPYHQSPPQNPPPSFPPSHYRDYCSSSYYNPSPPPPNNISFTTTTGHLEPISVPSSSCYTSTTTASIISHPFYQNQESSLVSHVISPMQCYNYPITTDRSLLMFGSEASCSSSDGSCSHGKQEEMMMGFQNFMYSSSNKSMLCNDGGEHVNQYCWEPAEKPISNGCFFQTQSGGSTSTPLDYDLEVIKQLISSNSSSGYGFSVDDENKTEEKAMLY